MDSCHSESGVHCVLFGFGLRCRQRSTTCSSRDRHRLARASRRGHCSGPQAVFASPARKAHSQVLSCRLHRGCLQMCSCCAKSGRYPKACPTAHSSSRMLASHQSTPTCLLNTIWHQRRTFLVARSRNFPVCGNNSSDIQRPRHLPPMSPHSADSFLETLVSTAGKTGQPARGTGGQTWNSRHSAWRVGRSRAPFTVLAELSRWLEGFQGLRRPWAPSPKLPICHQQGTSTQACLMDQSVAWALVPKATWERLSEKRWLLSCNVGSASPTLVARCRHPPASSMEELEKIGSSNDGSRLGAAQLERLKLTRESNPSLVIRAHERNAAGPRRAAWRAVVLSQACSRQGFAGGVRMFASRWPRQMPVVPAGNHRVVAATSYRPPWAPGVRRTLSHAPPPDSDASVQTSNGSTCALLMTAKLQDAASKSNSSNTRQGKRSHDILWNSPRGWQKWASKT